MNIVEPFIRRPVMTVLVMASILLAGIMGYRNLPVSDLPNVDFPTIAVFAGLPGASPETMASAVATTLEKQFSSIAGLTSMISSNSKGSTQVTLQFDLNRDIDAAAQDVQTAIAQAAGNLPTEMPSLPSYRKVNPADQPIFYLALISDTQPLSTIDYYAETFMAQRISMIPGVAQVSIQGPQKYAVRIQLDPRKLAVRSIGIDEVISALRDSNVNLPTGDLEGANRTYSVLASGQLTSAAEYRPLIVAYRNGAPVRLESLGQVLDSVERDKVASWYNNTRSIILSIQKQPGSNTIEVVDAIRALIPKFRAEIPPSIQLEIHNDKSQSIRESVRDVKMTLGLTITLVILVIFAFLRSFSATLIPSLALPLSLIGTFAVMYLLGYSIDNLSMMAIILSVGFVVDDAIVVLENIVRHREMGKDRVQAALDGSKEIGFTIVSMTLSLAAVFIPVLFMGGIVGRLLREFAVTISVAILISGFISLTLTPMLCSRYLRAEHGRSHGVIYKISEWFFEFLLRAYDRSLKMSLRFRFSGLIVFFSLLAATIWLFNKVPKGFIPSEDIGQIFASGEVLEGSSFEDNVRHIKAASDLLMAQPEVASIGTNVSGGTEGRFFIRLKPRAPIYRAAQEGERNISADEFIEKVRPKLSQIPGIRLYLQNPPAIRLGGRPGRSQYQFTLQSPNTEDLYQYAPMLEASLRSSPLLQDISSDLQVKNPQVNVEINRDKASSLGLNARKIEDVLFSAYGSRQISTFYTPDDAYKVLLELLPEYQRDPGVLSMLYVRAGTGQLVPLNAFTEIKRDVGPLSVNHQGQLPAVTVSFNMKPGVSLGQGVDEIQRLSAGVLPQSVSTSFQGTAQAFTDSLQGLGVLLILAIVVIYIVLGILYESFIHPFTILSGLPAAGFGALAALMLFHMELNLYSFVGVILLIGIVKKNAIMMIDFALEAQKSGVPPEEAIYQGCIVRFRPIMMTTMAALMGGLPIALGFGAGAEARRPLGVAIVGGLLFSQFLTLYITPIFYIYLEKLRRLHKPASETAREPSGAMPSPTPAGSGGMIGIATRVTHTS